MCKPRNISLFLSSIFLSATFFLYLSLNLFTDTVSPEGTPGSCGGWTPASCTQTGTQKDSTSPVWMPDRLIHHVTAPQTSSSPIASTTKEERHSSAPAFTAHLKSPTDSKMTNTRDLGKKLNVQINYSVGPNVISCKQCRLSSYLTPQYVCSFVVSQRPPYLMVSVTVTTYWYDNYGLAVLQLQGLMPS